MVGRQYYSQRNRLGPFTGPLDLVSLRRLVGALYQQFEDQGYFQQAFGGYCVDGDFQGTIGNVGRYFLFRLRKDSLWPIESNIDSYTEDDVFDVLEMLADLVSKPLEGAYHDWNNCGYHYNTFDQEAGVSHST
jgi:Neuromedin U